MKKVTFIAASLFAVLSFGQVVSEDFSGGIGSWTSFGQGSSDWSVSDGVLEATADNNAGRKERVKLELTGLTANTSYTVQFDWYAISDADDASDLRIAAGVAGSNSGDATYDDYSVGGQAEFTGENGGTLTDFSAQKTTSTHEFVTPAGITTAEINFNKRANSDVFIDNVVVTETVLSVNKYDSKGNLLPITATYNLLGQQVNLETAPTGIYMNVYSNGYVEKIFK